MSYMYKALLLIKIKEVDMHTFLHTENIDFYNKFSNSACFLTKKEFAFLKDLLNKLL